MALLGTPDDRAAILAVSETSVRVSQSVSPLLFSIISMKWLWDGAYASGFAVGILIRGAPSEYGPVVGFGTVKREGCKQTEACLVYTIFSYML